MFIVGCGENPLLVSCRNQPLAALLFPFALVSVCGAALALHALLKGRGVELVTRAVAKILNLVTHERGYQPVGFRSRKSSRHLFQFFNRQITANACAHLAAAYDIRPL